MVLQGKLLEANKNPEELVMKRVTTAIQWYRILRAHYQWPLFESIRFALWLGR
jgi:hypothetical protein